MVIIWGSILKNIGDLNNGRRLKSWMLQYLFSAALNEFFQARATVTLISTCAFSRGPSEKHHPCDLGGSHSDGEPAAEKTFGE